MHCSIHRSFAAAVNLKKLKRIRIMTIISRQLTLKLVALRLKTLGLALVLSVGCDSGTVVNNSETTTTGESGGNSTAAFTGATFVSADQLESGLDARGNTVLGNWTVSFTTDEVTWSRSDVTEVGSYSSTGSSNRVAQFPDRQVNFELDGGDLIWDSLSYRRAAKSLFNSQESLVSYLDGFTFNSVDDFDLGENASGGLAMGPWSVVFDSNEISWRVQDTVSVGTYSYNNEHSFTANFTNNAVTIYVLSDGRLMIDSNIYDKGLASQFDSQESLVAFLDGVSYRSASLQDTGETANGVTSVGYWHIDFTDNTFVWSYQGVSEAGTYTYLDNDNFTAILSDREIIVEVQGGDILWDNTRYISTVNESGNENQNGNSDVDFRIIVERSSGSGIGGEATEVITDQQRLNSIFAANQVPAESINFGIGQVLFVDAGSQNTGGYSLDITSVEDFDSHVVANVVLNRPGLGCAVTQAFTRPIMIAFIETTKEIQTSFTSVARQCSF